jgi:prevent-host-death family protein
MGQLSRSRRWNNRPALIFVAKRVVLGGSAQALCWSCREWSASLLWPSLARIQELAVATYSIAQAKDHLSKLIDEALAGEDVTITRHGKPVAHLRSAVERPIRQPSQELVAKIVERAKKRPSLGESAVDMVRRMRDGKWD